jgi:predicted Zn-dependent peptidase
MPRARLEKRLLGTQLIPGLGDVGAYQAAAQWTPRRHAGEFVVFAQMRSEEIEDVKNALLDEVRKVREGTLTAPELERAKNFARGSWAIEREALRDRAFQSAIALSANGPPDVKLPEKMEAITAADVRRVAQKYLQNYAVTLIMPRD